MSDHSALAAKLQALAATDAVFIGKARVISTGGAPAPLAAVLAEIDNSVLERTLVFDIDGKVLRLSVAGRRLRGVVDVSDAPQSLPLTGKVLSPDDPATMHAIGTLLTDLCKGARQITVQSRPAEPFGNPSEAGMPAAALSTLWQGVEHADQSPMQRFLNANDTRLAGFLHATDGAITATQGDTGALELIWQNQCASFHNRQKALFPRQDGPLLVCLDHALADGHAAAIAIVGPEVSIFAYAPDAISPILASWRQIMA